MIYGDPRSSGIKIIFLSSPSHRERHESRVPLFTPTPLPPPPLFYLPATDFIPQSMLDREMAEEGGGRALPLRRARATPLDLIGFVGRN